MAKTKVALLGAGFIGDIHIESYHRFVPEAKVVAVYSRDGKRAETFAKKHHIERWFSDLDAAIKDSGCEVVDVCLPNFLHARATLTAAKAMATRWKKPVQPKAGPSQSSRKRSIKDILRS